MVGLRIAQTLRLMQLSAVGNWNSLLTASWNCIGHENTCCRATAIVGGYIQAIYPFDDPIALVCNEEGKLIGLPQNRLICGRSGRVYDIICGTFFLVGLGAEDFISLTDNEIKSTVNIFRYKKEQPP